MAAMASSAVTGRCFTDWILGSRRHGSTADPFISRFGLTLHITIAAVTTGLISSVDRVRLLTGTVCRLYDPAARSQGVTATIPDVKVSLHWHGFAGLRRLS